MHRLFTDEPKQLSAIRSCTDLPNDYEDCVTAVNYEILETPCEQGKKEEKKNEIPDPMDPSYGTSPNPNTIKSKSR